MDKSKIFIIHYDLCLERKPLVEKIVGMTGATVFSAIKDRKIGCYLSHLTIYKSKESDLIVFEDDCEILDKSFIDLLPSLIDQYDLVYFGVNHILKKGSYGTHAMWISDYARQCFINNNGDIHIPVDHMWNHIENKYNLRVWRPNPKDRYVRQKIGLKSITTGGIRT